MTTPLTREQLNEQLEDIHLGAATVRVKSMQRIRNHDQALRTKLEQVERELQAYQDHCNAVRIALGVSEFSSRPLACYVTTLQAENTRLREALEALRDVQNGPPLCKYEKDWQEAMRLTNEALTPTTTEETR